MLCLCISHLYDSDIGIDGGIDEYIDDIALPNAWWFTAFKRDGDNEGIDICAPPIKLFCISVGVGVPDPATVVLILVLVVGVMPADIFVLPTLVGVRRWLRSFSSRRHFARRLENQT